MITDQDLQTQLPYVLTKTSFDFLGERYEGKVRDNYLRGDLRYLITTDRLSCFDVVVTSIPFKGQVLNELALYWFKITTDIVPNHILDVPDPNVLLVKECQMLPVEVVVRAYLAGSAWRDYIAGKPISGVQLPRGLQAAQQLPEVILTPSTKAAKGAHDQPISSAEIIQRGLVEPKLWANVCEASLELFARGAKLAKERGLILVDTKYEFGLNDGKLVLADEIHTLDSSRYWVAESYPNRFAAGESPEMLDKEPVRQWLLARGYKGEGAIPEFTPAHRVEIARHYLNSYQKITGKSFNAAVGAVADRIEAALRTSIAGVTSSLQRAGKI